MTQEITVAIAENHIMYRNCLVNELEELGIKVIAAVSNGKDLLEKLNIKMPDIVLLDIEMPVMNGAETLKIIRNKFSKLKVVILSFHEEEALIHNFIDCGASAFINKEKISNAEEIITVLRRVHQEGFYIGNLPRKEISFTKREIEVALLLNEGHTALEISELIKISIHTVNKFISNLHVKTNTHSHCELLKTIF